MICSLLNLLTRHFRMFCWYSTSLRFPAESLTLDLYILPSPSPFSAMICHIHSESSEKHIWKCARWASGTFFACIMSLTANSPTSTKNAEWIKKRMSLFLILALFSSMCTVCSSSLDPLQSAHQPIQALLFCHSLFPRLCAVMAAQKWLSQMFQCSSVSGGYTVLCM